jgi:hypothetical protein
MSRQPAVEIRFSLTRNRRGRCPLAASDPPLFGLAALMALMAQQGIHRARVPFWAATDQYFLTVTTRANCLQDEQWKLLPRRKWDSYSLL